MLARSETTSTSDRTQTFGVARYMENEAIPTIGNGVDIGCHVCILGAVDIGDHAKIGAGAIVLRDVPQHALAVGVPARVIQHLGNI